MTGKLHLTDTAIVNKNYTGYSDVHYDMQVVGVCTELNLFMCASFRVFSLNFEGDKFPLADFLRDNFNFREELAQWRGLAQTL